MGRKMETVTCPRCHGERKVQRWKTLKQDWTGLCGYCNSHHRQRDAGIARKTAILANAENVLPSPKGLNFILLRCPVCQKYREMRFQNFDMIVQAGVDPPCRKCVEAYKKRGITTLGAKLTGRVRGTWVKRETQALAESGSAKNACTGKRVCLRCDRMFFSEDLARFHLCESCRVQNMRG